MKSINIYMAADRDLGLLTKELRTEIYLINTRLDQKNVDYREKCKEI